MESFKLSELGRIHAQLPLKELAEKLAGVFPKEHPQGKKHLFPPEDEVALIFLKAYTGLSDDGLIELLNGSIHMQLFCGVLIDPQNPIKNGKIVSAIHNRLARYLNIKELQAILYDKWAPKLANKDLCLTDATCYECHLRYPRDVKLLWESSAWLHTLLSKNLEKENRETNVTCFARKGPKPKDEDADLHTTKRIIGYLRATVMEGSFQIGNT